MPEKTKTPPPAYFLSLSLENVRSFGDKQTIWFTEGGKDWKEGGKAAQWTIILGDNGVGKTTVLRSLAMLRPVADENIDILYAPISFQSKTKWPHDWKPSRIVENNNTLLGYEAEFGLKLNNKQRETRIINPAVSQIVFEIDRIETKKQHRKTSLIGPEIQELICYGYGAGRTVGNSTLSGTSTPIDTCASLFDDRADLLNPEEWFLQMEYSALKGEKQDGESLNQVLNALLEVLPDVTDIRISSKGHQQYLELETPYGWVRLRDMSLGYQTLVVWLTDFASKLFIRYPNSPNPLEEPAVVLIDEIDLHLHPSWQRKLIGFLSGIFKNTQFIATAHSPLVVQAAGDQPSGANVVLLKREGDQTIVYQGEDLPDVRRWRLDQILSSELFDEVPAHSPDTEKKLQRRDALLAKSRLSASEKKELAELNDWDNTQPIGNSQPERKAADVLRELARKLGKQELLD